MKVFMRWYKKEWSITLHIDNGSWLETLNLLYVHVSTGRCETLHFVKSYMKQNKSRNQTLKRVQNGLEIIFNQISLNIENVISKNTVHNNTFD